MGSMAWSGTRNSSPWAWAGERSGIASSGADFMRFIAVSTPSGDAA